MRHGSLRRPGHGGNPVGTLTRGNSFGEQGLLSSKPRRFTIRAASDLALLRLNKKDFEHLLGGNSTLREYFDKYVSEISIRNFLKLCTVFAPLSADEIRNVLGSMDVKDYAANQAIIREGETGDAFYILRSGSAQVIKESDGGKVLRLRAHNHVFEFTLDLASAKQWDTALPARRIDRAKAV